MKFRIKIEIKKISKSHILFILNANEIEMENNLFRNVYRD